VKFTPEELREFKLLCKRPAEVLNLLAIRLDRLDIAYHTPPAEHPNIDNPRVEIEEGGSSFLYRHHFDSHPSYGRVVGHPPAIVETQHHRWHDLAHQIDGAHREAIPGKKPGHPSEGGPAARFVHWAIVQITGDKTVTLGAVAKELQKETGKT
jgi:hypothetical protein